MNWNVLSAIFRRNFISYFSSPTGYVFISVFVLLSSIAAFWTNEFFNANLANLDQLSKYLPLILLVFIPAITMSVWADERRQGTDELLLTIPATDLDVVLGKFLATVAIFSVALGFSMLSNFIILQLLGGPDGGLFFGTYVGYWMVGLAMLAIGMVASFLTNNLTVSYILGVAFNAPLAFSGLVESIIGDTATAQTMRSWSLDERFRDFSRGVLSLSSTSYFLMLMVVMLYLALVLIGRRHWLGGRDGSSMLGHYVVRTLSLLVVAFGVTMFFTHHDVARVDVTSEQLSSLSPATKKRIAELKATHPVRIEAYISPQVPSEYVQTRLNLLSALDEFRSLGSGKIEVVKHILENYSDEAALAEQKYNIKPQRVISRSRGAIQEEQIFLGVAFTCGLDKVVVPFLDKGLPAEYELIRSICTVAEQKRKKIGVVKTDAELFGGFDMQRFTPTPPQAIIEELKKQYDVVDVDANKPITDRFDALLAVQPSTLGPQQMEHLVDAVKRGQPTAIFEDPLPLPSMWGGLSGTSQPRKSPQQSPFMMGRQQAPPKGDITKLWDLLGVDMISDEIIWQDWNPMPKAHDIQPEFVFIGDGSGAKPSFETGDSISSHLQQVLFLYPGSFTPQNKSKLEFTELARTGPRTGTVSLDDMMRAQQMSGGRLETYRGAQTNRNYVIAAHIRGKLKPKGVSVPEESHGDATKQSGLISLASHTVCADDEDNTAETNAGQDNTEETGASAAKEPEETKENDEAAAPPASPKLEAAPKADAPKNDKAKAAKSKSGKSSDETEEEPAKPAEINVVLVADIDCLSSVFFEMRSRGQDENEELKFNLDNVTLVLNALDVLAGEDRFVEIRKRRHPHRTLVTIDASTETARDKADKERIKFVEEFKKASQEAEQKFNDRMAQIDKQKDSDAMMRNIEKVMANQDAQRKRDIRVKQLEDERNRSIKTIERELDQEIAKVQNYYKWLAVTFPLIPPLILGLFVYFHRRAQEHEGVSKDRLV